MHLGASLLHAGDRRGQPRLLVRHWQTLLHIAISCRFQAVLAWWRGVESNACSPVLAVLFSAVDRSAASETARGTLDGLSDVPLAFLCEPPEGC